MTPIQEALAAYRKGDFRVAREKFIPLASLGSKPALLGLGLIYERGGDGVEKDIACAIQWYERALAEGKATEAALALGRIYYFGYGVPVNYDKAYRYYAMLEADKNPLALMMLGNLCENGWGTHKDLSRAAALYRQSTKLGNIRAQRAWGVLEIRTKSVVKGLVLCWSGWVLHKFYSMFRPTSERLRIA